MQFAISSRLHSQLISVQHLHRRRRNAVRACAGLTDAKTHDLLACLGTDGQITYLEVLNGWSEQSASCTVAWKGQMVRLSAQRSSGDGAASVLSCERAGVISCQANTVSMSSMGDGVWLHHMGCFAWV